MMKGVGSFWSGEVLPEEKKKEKKKDWLVQFQNKFESGQDFPGGTVVKNLPANAGDMGSSPGPGRSHMLRSN